VAVAILSSRPCPLELIVHSLLCIAKNEKPRWLRLVQCVAFLNLVHVLAAINREI